MYERDVGERLVAAAKPRFKDFRVDFEKISTAASKAAREARDGLDPAAAIHWFNDVDWHLRGPLQRRYADEARSTPSRIIMPSASSCCSAATSRGQTRRPMMRAPVRSARMRPERCLRDA